MRVAALFLLVALPSRAGAPESVAARGAAGFETATFGRFPAFKAATPRRAAPPARDEGPVLQPPLRPLPFSPSAGRLKEVARVNLAGQLDRQRALLTRQLGAASMDIGVASDRGLQTYYLVFTPAGQRAPATLAALGDLNRLRGAGIDARVDAATVYNFKVSINIFSPVRGSTLQARPVLGTHGPSHDVKTGIVLDAVKGRAAVFHAGGKEFWLHYGTDVNAAGTGFADTRSFLIINENGLSSKAWSLAESALTPDSPATVDLGGTPVALTRTAAGELLIAEPNR